MSRNLQQLLRPLVPNVGLRIRHVEPSSRLQVRFREHLGLIARGAKAYEPHYVSVFRSLLSAGDTVFDVGANIGFYSILFSAWVGARGRVIAYEPDPANLKLLERNVDLNGCQNVVVRPVALSKSCGSDVFSIDRITRSTGHLGHGATYGGTIFGDASEDLINVVTSTLDEELADHGAPQLIKMDIEGGEYNALLGGAGLLQRHRPLIVSELNVWTSEDPNGTGRASRTMKLLTDFEYSLWNVDTGVRVDDHSAPWMFLAVPREKENHDQVAELLRG
jgi:FkbM family methyltransferase